MTKMLTTFGDFALFSAQVLRRLLTGGYRRSDVLAQLHRAGVGSLTVVILCAAGIGVVMVLQSASLLARYGAKAQVATLMSAAFVREIGPVFTAIMFAGRVGTGIAAELGSMVVTEQVDAYKSFGSDPLRSLAAPRVLAAMLMLPALTVIANVVGVFSGYLFGVFQLDVAGSTYLRHSTDALTTLDVTSSVVKALAFGCLIALVATFKGLRTRRATEAVGESTTQTMVACVLGVLLVDVMLTKLFVTLGE